jgi:hypothetical protein
VLWRPRVARTLLVTLAILVAIVTAGWPGSASAAPADPGLALVARYAPVMRLKDVPGSCGLGEPYVPVNVNLVLGNPEVALRGPWDPVNLVGVAPTAQDLSKGLWGYHLDFPGSALQPGCTYEEWQHRLMVGQAPLVYGRVVTQAGVPGKLAVQYWFFYVFNDWVNTHEGDWEMIQLNFDAPTAAAALDQHPVDVGYSQHSSAERAAWGHAPLETVNGTHPVVYVASGSQANFFRSDLFLMRSSAEGVGCDDTTGPSSTITPTVATIPTARGDYLHKFPWLGFDGRWGEQHAAFYNGPTGPNEKIQWTEPFTWAAHSWRAETFAVPAARVIPTPATDFFCGAVARGSVLLRQVKTNPLPWLIGLAALVIFGVWLCGRTTWRPVDPSRLARRRPIGRVITAGAARFWVARRLFLGIGLLFVPIGVVVALLQALVFNLWGLTPLINDTGRQNAFVGTLVLLVGVLATLLGLAIVQAATARLVRQLDLGETVGVLDAYRGLRGRVRGLLRALLVLVLVQIALDVTIVLIPVAIYVLVRWSLLGVVAGLEDDPRPGILRRSAALTRGNWWRAAVVTLGVTGAALLVGPVVGGLVLIATSASFGVVNVIAAIVNVAALPFSAVVLTFLYYDLVERSGESPVSATDTPDPSQGGDRPHRPAAGRERASGVEDVDRAGRHEQDRGD